MSVSFASVTPTNIALSPMRVTYKGVDLGGTTGNVAVAIETMKADIKIDQLGDTVVDRRVSGHKFTVTTELSEVKLKDNWKVVFDAGHLITSGGNKSFYFDSQVGAKDSDGAGALLLHPLEAVDADKSTDFNFYKAIADGKSEVVYGPNGQVKLKIIWNILPDFSVGPAKFMLYGDPAVGLIAASAGSPAFTGTGNGTMTGVTVYSGVTKTETITAKVVTPQSNAGIFEVHGSLSGPLGLATVGVAFVSGPISFTINDGTIDFILNDQFTVATTAANYV